MVMVGPDDDRPRPTVILFHGCGGLREHLPRYAQAAKAAGWRACIVDSYPHRGLTPWMALGLVAVVLGVEVMNNETMGAAEGGG